MQVMMLTEDALLRVARNIEKGQDKEWCVKVCNEAAGQVKAWRAELSRLREAERWVPVTERLPEYTADYNVACNIGCMLGGYECVRTYRFERIKGEKPKWCIPNKFDEIVVVTHWRPLPAGPGEGEEGGK